MNLILAILLYFNSINSGQSYTWEQITEITTAQQPSIQSVQQNPQQMLQVQQDYGQEASLVDITNKPAGY